MHLWIILGIVIALFVIALIVMMFSLSRKNNRGPDYYQFFIIGIVWIGAGTAIYTSSGNPGLLAMGVIFAVLGISNKSKWKENRRRFKDLTPEEIKLKKLAILALSVLMLVGIVTYYILN